MRGLIAALMLSASLLSSPPAAADLRAVLIGVDADAPGAAADAVAVGDALSHVYGRDVTVLTNDQAGPLQVRNALDALLARTRPGDLIIFGYAGAGGQQPERLLGSEPDRLDEVFRLADRNLATALRDTELAAWARQVTSRRAAVLLLLDTGHVDTPRRAAGIPGVPGAVPAHRGLPVQPVQRWPDDPDAFSALAHAYHDSTPSGLEDLPHGVMILEATNKPDHAATMFTLRDPATDTLTTRGPLSHGFAAAVRGAADANGDGQITADELSRHVQATVRQATDGAAAPGIRFRFAASSALFFLDPSKAPSTSNRATLNPDRQVTFDGHRRHAYSARGDLVAEQVDASAVARIADSRAAIDRLHALARWQPLDAETRPNRGLWTFGQRFSIHIGDPQLPFRLVANITGQGTVQMLFPERNDAPDRLGGLLDDLAVLGPFGTDSVVIIATAAPVPDLYTAFHSWAGSQFTDRMAAEVARLVQGTTYRMAILPIVSAAGGGASQ